MARGTRVLRVSHGYIDHIVEFLDEYLENDLDLNS